MFAPRYSSDGSHNYDGKVELCPYPPIDAPSVRTMFTQELQSIVSTYSSTATLNSPDIFILCFNSFGTQYNDAKNKQSSFGTFTGRYSSDAEINEKLRALSRNITSIDVSGDKLYKTQWMIAPAWMQNPYNKQLIENGGANEASQNTTDASAAEAKSVQADSNTTLSEEA